MIENRPTRHTCGKKMGRSTYPENAMPAPRPALKSEQIGAKIDELCRDEAPPTEFVRRQLLREIENLESSDAASAHALRGYLAAASWDTDGVISGFESALRLEENILLRLRYVTSLWRVQANDRAAQQAALLAEQAPGNPMVLDTAVSAFSTVGDYRSASMYCQKYNALKQEASHMSTDTYASIVELFADDERTWDMITKSNRIASEVLRTHRIRIAGRRTNIEHDRGSAGVMSYIAVRKSLDEVIELEAELTQRLFDEVQDLDFNKYWVGFETAEA